MKPITCCPGVSRNSRRRLRPPRPAPTISARRRSSGRASVPRAGVIARSASRDEPIRSVHRIASITKTLRETVSKLRACEK